MSLRGRSLVSLRDLTLDEIVHVLDVAENMAEAVGLDDPAKRAPAQPLDRLLATLFFEPSTRTRLSFEAAMLRLGGQVIGFADPASSSVQKGESLADTVRIAGGYADIIVIRHPLAGSAKVAAEFAAVPVINAGDGPHEHPTQTLTDLFCIRRCKGKLEGLTVGLCGDLKHGRTVHSLAPIMARFGAKVICISPEELRMPEEVIREVERHAGSPPRELRTLQEALPDLDILYMTRVQKERFACPEDYERLRSCCVLTPELMALAREDMIVLHPLPRVDEIAADVDADPRAKYFQQAAGGVPVRMALISLLLGLEGKRQGKGSFKLEPQPPGAPAEEGAREAPPRVIRSDTRCSNPQCITTTERYLEALFVEENGGLRCGYCEERAG